MKHCGLDFIAMAAEKSPSLIIKTKRHGFMHLLSSAACEWFLISLLFLNAALTYLLTKFAHYYELEPPCLLCSTLHISLNNRKQGCYFHLLCSHHRDEISCSVSCSVHARFADVRCLCEECLTPIISRNESNPDSYRLLVGKSWLDVDRSVLQNLVLGKHLRLGSADHRMCSCCGKTWRAKSGTERLLELNSAGLGASKANVKPPLPRAPGRSRFSRRDSLRRLRNKFTGQVTTGSVDTLSHVGYTKLKISSDSESEFLFSEDDDNRSTSSRVASPNLLDLSEVKNENSVSTDVLSQHGSGDLDYQESGNKRTPSLTPDLISLSNVPQQCDVAGGLFGASVESSKLNVALTHMPAISILSEFLSLCSVVPSSPNIDPILKQTDITGASEKEESCLAENIESVVETYSDETRPLEPTDKNQTNASTQTHKTGELEPTDTSDPAKSEEINNSKTQISTSESVSLSKENSPRAHDNKRDKHRTDEQDSGSSEALPISSSPRKRDPNFESFDGTTFSNIEGENIIDSLKCQVEHDRNLLNSLFKDLEEERNASAIAANQAMAMITRLQEEKAALHMEALQYLRMMEEQAEYDTEALGRANDLLAEKEKELQDLEIELEFYRNNFLDESGVHNLQSETSIADDSRIGVLSKGNGECEPVDSSLLNFEDEKLYILGCLRKLEMNLQRDYSGGKFDDSPNGLHSVRNIKDLSPNNGTLLGEEDGLIVENVYQLSNGNHVRDTSRDDCFREKNEIISENGGETNYGAFEKEIAGLYNRLEALEADRDFIKRISDMTRNGKDGLELIQETARQLQELRKMEFEKR